MADGSNFDPVQQIIASLPTPPSPIIDETGIHAPIFDDYLSYLINGYRAIYGADTYLGNDSQDGQEIALFALALSDQAAACVAAYLSFSPSTAQGEGLSTVVKINGLVRKSATYSTVDVRIVGVAGTEMFNGIVSDGTIRWNLPAHVVVPDAGEIIVTATAQDLGAINAAADTITTIETPTAGWQSVNNPTAATPGQPVETDALLRRRQQASTALPSVVVLDGIIGGIMALPGVTRVKAYENDTSLPDGDGIPAHSIAMVVEGGDAQLVAQVIAVKKTPGAGTYGTTTIPLVDNYGLPHNIKFFRPTYVPITVIITIHNLTGYTTSIGNSIVDAVIAAINGIAIGDDVFYTRLYVPAQLVGQYAQPLTPKDPGTFELRSVVISRDGNTPSAADVGIAFNEAALCDTAHVTLSVV